MYLLTGGALHVSIQPAADAAADAALLLLLHLPLHLLQMFFDYLFDTLLRLGRIAANIDLFLVEFGEDFGIEEGRVEEGEIRRGRCSCGCLE